MLTPAGSGSRSGIGAIFKTCMKKVIIAQTILDAIELSTTLFGRGSIQLYPARSSEDILDTHRQIKADLIITDFSFPVM